MRLIKSRDGKLLMFAKDREERKNGK